MDDDVTTSFALGKNQPKKAEHSDNNYPKTAEELQHHWPLRTPQREFKKLDISNLEIAAATINGNKR